MSTNVKALLGDKAEYLLNHTSKTILNPSLAKPGKNFIDESFIPSNRNNIVLGNLHKLYNTGRLSDTGYISILPVDQGIEHLSLIHI